MKHLKHLLAALVFVSLIVFTSCGGGKGGDGNPNPAADQAEKLVATWTLAANGAKLESQAVDGWTGFTLTFTGDEDGGNYSTTNVALNSEAVWPASGTWSFDGDDIGRILRENDGVSINISSVTATTLTLAFNINTAVRGSSVDGNWTFTFTTN